MRTQVMTTLMMVASLLVSGQAMAQPQLPTFQPGDVLRAGDLNRIVEQVKKNMPASGGDGGGATHTVDCSSGTIAAAMSQAQPGDTIMISGTCNETVVVDKDGIALDGGGSAVIDGSGVDASAIAVIGHQNVTIKGLTVQNGLNGIYIAQGAAAWLENVTAQGSRSQSGYESGSGIVVNDSSSVLLTGTIVANDNAWNGIVVYNGSSANGVGEASAIEGTRLPRTSIQANGNGEGIGIYGGSNFTAWTGVAVTATDNTYSGLSLSRTSTAFFYSSTAVFNDNGGSGVAVFEGSTATLSNGTISGNRGYAGLWITRGATVVASNLTVENNVHRGIGVYRSSFLDLYDSLVTGGHDRYGIQVFTSRAMLQGVTSTDNAGDGIAVSSGSHVNLSGDSSVTDNGGRGILAAEDAYVKVEYSTVTGNGTDIAAEVLSRIGWQDSTVGTIVCDDTVLTFYDAACPE